MNILLTESQYKKILLESQKNSVDENLQNSTSVVKNIITNIKKQYGIDFTFALTWGATIGGMIGPINDFMTDRYTNLSHEDIELIMFGVILTFFSSNKDKLKKVLELIKENGLITFFDQALMKTYDLKDAFIGFLESLNITFSKTSNMLAYCFLIPLIPIFKKLADLDFSPEDINLFVKGIAYYTSVLVSSKMIESLVSKILSRFRS